MHSKHVLDGFLDEVDEVDGIHEADDFSGAYEDFLLDIELAEKVSHLDYAPREGSQVRNSSLESQSPGCSGSGNAAVGMSESSMATVPASESKNGPLQKTVECKLFCSSGDKWDSREPAEDGVWLTSEDLDRLDDDAMPLTSLLSGKNAKKVVQAAKVAHYSDRRGCFLESEDEFVKKRCKKSNDRRKHQRMWTTTEVMKLIDGIAPYGTGRWTGIKKLLFSSTAYRRTPIDLRVPPITFSNKRSPLVSCLQLFTDSKLCRINGEIL
uniref:Myb-like domain-containing protein n=1 Tax=Salix viminalis TaxID=40686 RepID=A0A6N2NAL9_SALVM